MGNWSHVLNYVNKAENTSELAEVSTFYQLVIADSTGRQHVPKQMEASTTAVGNNKLVERG